MAPGPPNLDSNPFSVLDTAPEPKRRKAGAVKQTVKFPSLPAVNNEDPKFITIGTTDANKQLSSYSCFAVHRSLQLICNSAKEILSISQLRDGKLLLLVKNIQVAQKFISSKKLPGICDISVSYHKSLNCVKGTVYAPFLSNVSNDEIIQELSSQGVIEVYKFQKTIEGKTVSTGTVLLTFDLFKIPNNVSIAWTKVRVKEFIPSPMRCKYCQLLGHTAKFKRVPACINFGLPPHLPDDCSRIYCVNCAEKHPANSNSCTKYQQAKDILKIKTTNKCSMGEATRLYKSQISASPCFSTSYAEVINNYTNKKNEISSNSSHETINNISHTKINNQSISDKPIILSSAKS